MMHKTSYARSVRDTESRGPSRDDSETCSPDTANRWKIPFAIILILFIAVAGALCYWRWGGTFRQPTKGVATLSTDEINTLINKVSKLIVIKTDEKPTVATIQDADILRTQNPDFYKNAQNGDRLLIWSDKAVLYSSATDKLLAVLPIRIPTANPAPTTTATNPTTQPVENAVIEVRNGTQTSGLGKSVSDRLKAAGFSTGTYSSSVATYPSTVIVVAAGKSFPNTVARIKQLIGGTVGVLPAKELSLKNDILVIVGKDYKP